MDYSLSKLSLWKVSLFEKSSRMTKQTFFVFIFLIFVYGVTAQDRPNVIVILADDLGYADVGFNGSKEIPTPNIDRIAAGGVKFTDGYVTYPVCGPSRAGLITGRYQNRFGYATNPIIAPNDATMGLPLTERTLATELKKVGYTNAIIGKWHLGTHESLKPDKRGFDHFFGFLSGGHRYFPEEYVLNDLSEVKKDWDWYLTKLLMNNTPVEETEYLTDALSREAVNFIDQNKEKPFFLYLAYNAPHGPLQATETYLNRFQHIENEKRRTYAAMVSAMDDGIGAVLNKLEELKLDKNTLVVFLSDNGGPEHHNASDNGVLRAGKGSMYEGGIRVPFAMKWPSKIKAGSVYKQPVMSFDIFATVCANVNVDAKNELDGVDLLPFLNRSKKGAPHLALHWLDMGNNDYSTRIGDFKVVKENKAVNEAFDLSKDKSEKKPINSSTRLTELLKSHRSWRDSLPDPIFLGLEDRKTYKDIQNSMPEGYKLAWAEEFNFGETPTKNKWQFEEGFVRNKELQWYTNQNATIKDDKLIIEARREKVINSSYEAKHESWKKSRNQADYTSSCIKTKDHFSFQYGIMEVKAKIDTSMGLWPAIWLIGKERKWPACGEIDMMEFYRHDGEAKILANTAYSLKEGNKPIWNSTKLTLTELLKKNPNWPNEFHVWKMNWTEAYIHLYLDDELINVITLEDKTNTEGFNPFRQPHYILLNMAIGENGGNPENTTFPKTFEVDYVRVYQNID
jgi:arylsulfatase A-like enzyme/beta-glucanase (GH16 family)